MSDGNKEITEYFQNQEQFLNVFILFKRIRFLLFESSKNAENFFPTLRYKLQNDLFEATW